MNKKLITIFVLSIICINVLAANKDFNIDLNKVFSSDGKSANVTSLFSKEYKIDSLIVEETTNKEFVELVRKTTYILLGNSDKGNETAEDFYKRKTEFYNLRYTPTIPKTDDPNKGVFGYDSTSQEYKDDLLSGITIPGMWIKIAELEINYSYFGDIRIIETEDGFQSSITIPKIKYKIPDAEEPMKFKEVASDLTIYYIFKKNKYKNNEYQLYYLYGETSGELNDYFESIEKNEDKNILGLNPTYNSDMSSIYDYSKLDSLTDKQLQKIYNDNINKIVILTTNYNNSVVNIGSGFLLTNNVVVTTYDYLENALLKGQYISVQDKNKKIYELAGIITMDPVSNIALLKINNCSEEGVKLGSSKDMQKEDPIISFSTKSGLGISTQTGIVISNKNKLESLLPLTQTDSGSPLFNKNGEVVGINTQESINKSISYAVYTDYLKDLQNKVSKTNNIESITFEELKEKYYSKNNKELINNDISKKVWNKYSKIGNIEKNINL
ncbi:MAG: hypothetical protein GX758_04080, partial [Tenericutes bacterium]|nr:hypothetical protein [Mycoplasmatota bacterium]